MLKRIGLLGVLLVLFALPVFAQSPGFDHCQTGLKQTVPISIATATTTSLIAPITNTNIYICGGLINQAGGTGTVTLEYGTGSTCGTGTVVLVGPITANSTAGTTTNVVWNDNGYTQFDTGTSTSTGSAMVPSQRLCVLSTGTIQQSGYLVYVQE